MKQTSLVPKVQKLVSAFGKLTRAEQRQFVNAMISDQGPTNPKLGNSSRQSRGADQPGLRSGGAKDGRPATSQFTNPSPDEVDYFRAPRSQPGKFKDAPDDSLTPARITLSVRMRTNMIKGLTFERLVSYLDQWRVGFFRQAGMAWDVMERRDYQIQIVRPKRLKSVARHGYDILIRDDVAEGQAALAQQQKDFLSNFYGNARVTTALNPDEEGGFSLLVRQMMDAVGKYYAVHEIVWQPLPDGTLTAKFIFCPVWWFEGTRGKLRFLPSEFQIYGNDMVPGEWLVTCGDGIMEACSVLYLMKSLMLKSWISFLDKFGMPGIHGKTDAVKDSPEWNDFVAAVQDFAQEWSAVTNRSAELSLIEAKATGDAGFEKALEVFDLAITQLWRGGDLGTKSGQHSTGASLQQDETEILETDDGKNIEETLDQKVTKFALAWKFGPDTPQLAYIKLRSTPRRNIQDDISVDTFLAGFKDEAGKGLLGTQATLERYSRPLPKPDEDVLTSAAPAADPNGKPGTAGPNGQPPVPPGATDKNPEFGNVAAARQRAADSLDAGSQELVIEAILSEFGAINERLAAVAKIDDADLQKQKLAAILADLDKLEKNLHHDPAVAQAIYKILSANLANGLAGEKPEFANSDPGHTGRPGQVGGSAPGAGSPVQKLKDVMSGKLDEAVYAPVTADVAAKIRAATGQNVSGYHHFVEHSQLVHIDKQHGVGHEDQEDHLPISRDDIEKIPEIVSHPDTVEKGQSARGIPAVRYSKRYNGTTYYVEEIWAREKLLAAKTMYKMKTK